MKFNVGDRVRFLNDVGGGRITRIERNLVYVMGQDGFELPVSDSEIIAISTASDTSLQNQTEKIDNPYDKQFLTKGDIGLDEMRLEEEEEEDTDLASINFVEIPNDPKDENGNLLGLFFGFIPNNQGDKTNSGQQLYLINDSPYRVLYTLSKWEEDALIPLRAGFLYPDTKEFVISLKKEEINLGITLNLQCLFFKNKSFTPQQPEYFDYKLNPTKFYRTGSFTDNVFFDVEAMIVSVVDSKKEAILESITHKAVEESIAKKDMQEPTLLKKKLPPPIEEVDLHIGELVSNAKELKPAEILEIQMARFKVTLEGALKAKAKKIVFIHGVGNGKLKHELRKELDSNYPKLRYQDASFREYGYGATMVFIP